MRLQSFGVILYLLFSQVSFANEDTFCHKCENHADLLDEASFLPCEKTYIAAEDINFFQNGIYIKLQDKLIQTASIFADAKGLYFNSYRQGICEDKHWECSICHFCTHVYYLYCGACRNKR